MSLSCDAYISRSHCRIEIKDNVPFLLDLGSNTGTLLNGKKITCSPLKPGDIIRIGRTDFEFEVKEGNEIFSRNKYDSSSEGREKGDDIDLIEHSSDEVKEKKKKTDQSNSVETGSEH